MDEKIWILLFSIALPSAFSAEEEQGGEKVGTFFWKPRLGLDLAIPTTEVTFKVHQPSKDTIAAGLVVMIDGYAVGITIVALAAGISSGAHTYPHLDPTSAHFCTNVYRWGLRYFSLIPFWMSGNGGNFVDTHRTWRRRFYYMDEFMPKWMRYIFPYVKKEDWAKEELEWKRFKKYAEPAFGKHYRVPNKIFNNFKSCETTETIENVEASSSEEIL